MRNTFSLFTLALCLFLSACSNNSFIGSDNIVTITRDLAEFTKIEAEDALDLKINQGDEQLLEVMVNDNLQDQLITVVRNNTLSISIANGSFQNETFVVNITIPMLESLRLADATNAAVDFTSAELEFDINDASELNLRGSSETLDLKVYDASTVSGFSFSTEVLNTTCEDASEIEITCNSELNGTVRDASIVSYRGMPVINASTSDEGEIIDAN